MSVVEPMEVVEVGFIKKGIAPSRIKNQSVGTPLPGANEDSKYSECRSLHGVHHEAKRKKCTRTDRGKLDSLRVHEDLDISLVHTPPLGWRVGTLFLFPPNHADTRHAIDDWINFPMCAEAQKNRSGIPSPSQRTEQSKKHKEQKHRLRGAAC